jgi:hypothetical protein
MKDHSLILILFLTLLAFLSSVTSIPHHKKQQKKYDREWKSKRRDCLDNVCKDIHPDENENCLNKCTSESCYSKVFGGQKGELEPGEIDVSRTKQFQKCARDEVKERIKAKWKAAREAATQNSL